MPLTKKNFGATEALKYHQQEYFEHLKCFLLLIELIIENLARKTSFNFVDLSSPCQSS